jgi:hypothetical protein
MMIIPTIVVAHRLDDFFFFLVRKWYLVQVKVAIMAFDNGWWWCCGSVIGDSVIGDLDSDILKIRVGPILKYGTRA